MTYNQWIKLFKQFATANQFINGFYHGHNALRHFEKDVQYPFMHVLYMNSGYTLQAETVQFELLFMDLPIKKHYELQMETELLSDMKQAAEDLIAEIRNGMTIYQFTDRITILDSRVNPLVDKDQHVITGVSLDITLEVPYTADACLAPFEGSIITGGCPTLADLWQSIQVINSIGCELHPDVNSPTTLITIPNIEVSDTDSFNQIVATPTSIFVRGTVTSVTVVDCALVITTDTPPPATDIVYQRSTFRGQLTSYALYDQGWQAANGTYDYSVQVGTSQRLDYSHAEPWFNLLNNNAFGNKSRFTDSDGVPAPDLMGGFSAINWAIDRPTALAYYVIDHLIGYGWIIIKIELGENWNDALGIIDGYSYGGFSDFRMPSPTEAYDVINPSASRRFFEPPNIFFRSDALSSNSGLEAFMWLNETDPTGTGLARIISIFGDISRINKVASGQAGTYAIRTHYT